MSIVARRLESISEADLDSLVRDRVPESLQLEYKRELPAPGDRGAREFLKDVTAMANASGGLLLFGVADQDDVASEIVGLEGALGPETQRLQQILASGVAPRLQGVRFHEVPLASGRGVLALGIPRSLARPHMVVREDMNRFYQRVHRTTQTMTVDELRVAFLEGDAGVERVRRWRAERLAALAADEGVYPMQRGPHTVIHLVPLGGATLDPREVRDRAEELRPLAGMGYNQHFNLEGFARVSMADERVADAYVQAYRTGQLEWVSYLSWTNEGTPPSVFGDVFECDVLAAVRDGLATYARLGVVPPFAVMATVRAVGGMMLRRARVIMPAFRPILLPAGDVMLPPVVLEDAEAHPPAAFRAAFDMLWQAGGYQGSPNYRDDGSYQRPNI